MSYIGRQNLGGAYRQLDDISSGFDGSDTTHTMQVNSQNVTVGDVNQIILSLGGVIQKPGTDFTVSGSTLTFTTAPASGLSFFAILLGSDNGGTVTPTDVSVTKAKLADEVDIFAGTSLSAADLGAGVHIKSGDAGTVTASSQADDLVIENSSEGGMTIITPDDQSARIRFTSPSTTADTGGASILYRQNINKLILGTSRSGGVLDLRSGESTSAINADASGHVTMPKQPAFQAIPSGTQSNIATGSNVQIEFGTERFDVNGDFLGKINFKGNDSSSGASGTRAAIEAKVVSNFGSTELHFKTADSGASVSSDADELILENSRAGMSFLSATDNYGIINFGDSGDNNIGQILYYHTDNDLSFVANNTTYITIDSSMTGVRIDSGKFSTFGESAPDCGDGGITLQQGSNDDSILTMKSSDVAHGITDNAETDTYAVFKKNDGNSGGLDLFTFSERTDGEYFRIIAHGNGLSSTKSTSGIGAMHFVTLIKSGTGAGAISSNDNILTISNGASTRFIFDQEGDFHADSSSTTFDAYEDAHLIRAYDLSHGKGVIDSKFDKFVSYNHEKLAELQLVGREEDGTPNNMVSVTGMQRLHNGAIWQQYEKHQRLAEAVYEMAKEALGEDKADAILKKHDIKLLN